MVGTPGALLYLPDRHMEMRATLYRIEDDAEIMFLSRARVIKAGHGGILFGGVDRRFRGVKSKGDEYRQSWWCVPMTKVVLPPSQDGYTHARSPRVIKPVLSPGPAVVVAIECTEATNHVHPTILRMPTWYSKTAFEEMVLDLTPDDYVIVTAGDRVSVNERASGQLVYAGIGPVEIIKSSAPF